MVEEELAAHEEEGKVVVRPAGEEEEAEGEELRLCCPSLAS